ncbi:MAG: DegT/DnrJ/EryC1/StrS family aminotransferase [Candidatus Staskawiczbacteria bacterium]|nr:DegT/DnrJ/EryC1/StrS family aminotransferase [Candidatus Staskawiczbacteria bacterium]
MDSKKINQMEPWLDAKEQKAMAEYLKSGAWLTEFKKTREFEQQIADFTGVKYCSVVNNGTVSLAIALMAMGIGPKDEVIVPDYTMIASATAINLAGAKPVFVDIDKKTLCLDLDLVKKAVTKKTKAIMLVTINGRYPKMEEFVDFCKQKKIFLLEDAAQSLGSTYKGKHLGAFGDIGSFSFSVPKIITTGQGGALITDSEDLYKKILKIKDFGREKSGVDYHEVMGYNFKFTDLQAVIGVEQMKKLALRVDRKKNMARLYKDLLEGVTEVECIETNFTDTAPWFIDILVPQNKRGALIAFLAENNIGTRPFYPAIHTQPPYAWVKGTFKNADEVSARGLWLPSSAFLTDKDVKHICSLIITFFKKQS